ncbi:hypothetical protein K491DRAFT_685321 [Lophiostoma macrostomum CBS 122681]|uniref:Zn(2)-C6 fungal-type domain-containing protein n=1 Tax=Lophiostoma macrostomum CBS 122681 TaxID=1314788 RepID=A0A6A6SMV0_9PLEO|nr:hypothetical protein K491DRAFT_685321 [Lophiostoma macrostomum CBS 122681]
METEHRCRLCSKAFGRRDLRNRHQSRCAKTFGKERASKRKSCETCMHMKLRCSLARPACSRCTKTGSVCHYPNPMGSTTTTPAQRDHVSNNQPFPTETISPKPVSVGLTSKPVLPVPAITLPEDVRFGASGMNSIWSPTLDDVGLSNLDIPGFLDFSGDDALLPWANMVETFLPPLSSSSRSSDGQPSARPDDEGTGRNNIFAHTFMSDPSQTATRTATSISRELCNILRDYPTMMLQPTFWSPFIHHRLYRCSKGGMAEPLGIALACVAAYSSAVTSSFKFVDEMVNSQRERLVHDFHLYTDRPETCLAVLHAVCMYQILGLFGGQSGGDVISAQSTPQGSASQRREDSAKSAELYGPFLLKARHSHAQMTRLFCKQHQKALMQDEGDWPDWQFSESLRRNMFLVHVVNILGARARKLHHGYFEPLNDAMILEMPLPAPESMWCACSDSEWRTAREYAILETSVPNTLQGLLDLDRGGGLAVASLPPLTRVILACHKIPPSSMNDEED